MNTIFFYVCALRLILMSNHLNNFITCKPQSTNLLNFESTYSSNASNLANMNDPFRLVMNKPTEMFSGNIPEDKIKFRYSQSSGPGGQNVNQVNTKVQIRFKLAEADWIPEEIRQKLLQTRANQINKDGYLVLQSQRCRSQYKNRIDVLEKLRCIIFEAYNDIPKMPTREKLKKIKSRKRSANIRRLHDKKMHSMKKRRRGILDD